MEFQLASRTGKLTHDISNFERQKLIEVALTAGKILLEFRRHLHVSWAFTALLQLNLYEIAVTKSSTFPLARRYIKSVFEVFNKICPYSEKLTRTFKQLNDRPEQHRNFLLHDQVTDELTDELIENIQY